MAREPTSRSARAALRAALALLGVVAFSPCGEPTSAACPADQGPSAGPGALYRSTELLFIIVGFVIACGVVSK